MGGTAAGIGLARSRADDGALEYSGLAAPISSPSFLVGSASGVIYATDEAGRIEAFRRDRDRLEPIGGQPSSGDSPCHVSVTADRLLVSNYGSGSIDVFPVAPSGEIGPVLQTLHGSGSGPEPAQDGPHAHSTLVGRTVLSADLGSDEVHVHTLEGGVLERVGTSRVPAGTGPRDLALLGGRIILLGELSGELFALDDSGAIMATGALVTDWVPGDHAAALAVDGSARFLYSGIRGSNRIAVVRLADLTPIASVPSRGDWPRHLTVVGDFLHVANERSNTLATFRLDTATGMPIPVGEPAAVSSPTYLLPVQ
jgi:6-phosphogluconolactonase (cycloisomerase 2 family)